jgi:septum formation protein
MQQTHLQRPRLILASGSPRRRELLAQAGYAFEVVPPSDGAEDENGAGEPPSQLVARLARQKAANVASRCAAGLILGCDTVVECQGQILGKPDDRLDARRMLQCLSGREHRVYSGLCLWERPADRQLTRIAVTRLIMQPLSHAQLEEYLDSRQWQGKAGAFGYQDGHDWLRVLEGSESNVVGLPLELLAAMCEEFS